MRRKVSQIVLIVTVIAIAHFAASFYVTHKIGTIAGTLVVETFISADDGNEGSVDMAEQIAERFEESSGSWITLSHILAFPVGLLTKPLSDTVTRKLGHTAVVERTLSPEEMRARLWAFGTFSMALNSIVVALCIMGVYALIKKNVLRTEHANAAEP